MLKNVLVEQTQVTEENVDNSLSDDSLLLNTSSEIDKTLSNIEVSNTLTPNQTIKRVSLNSETYVTELSSNSKAFNDFKSLSTFYNECKYFFHFIHIL